MTQSVRRQALDYYDVLDTPQEKEFDDIVLLASQICRTPIAQISFVADDRQWFKAQIGFDRWQTPLDQSVCVHAIKQPGVCIIPDLMADPRTQQNPLVRGEPYIRFYAGARLETPTGEALGTVCVIDTQPRPHGLTLEQANSLQALARQVMALLELRLAHRRQSSELLTTQDVLRHARKMEAIGQLSGGIAHDFNNLLMVISGSIEIVRRRLHTDRQDTVPELLEAAAATARQGSNLTQRLLAFARRRPLERRPVNINDIVAGTEEVLRRTLGAKISLQTVLAADLWQVEMDQHQLENAVLNLAINARDAMPEGGRLTIKTGNLCLDACDERVAGEYVRISISDTGGGMAPEILARALDPFFTTKPEGAGTGLGLSMIHSFVQECGGGVTIDSTLDEGTTVQLYFPRVVAFATAPIIESVPTIPTGRGETILVVEDQPAVRSLVGSALTELGYRPLEASNATAALAVLQDDRPIVLLLADIGLPETNGLRLAEIARERQPDLKVLFLTGYTETVAAYQDSLGPGMDMLSKPVGLAVLGTKIQDLIRSAPPADTGGRQSHS